MTAEVAILNRSAVALAADSLVTVRRANAPTKTYEVNKLFTLSKHHPVGIMVYDSGEFLGLPWETVIKTYRKTIGRHAFDTVREYADHFLQWIGSSVVVCPESSQRIWFLLTLSSYYSLLSETIDKAVEESIGSQADLPLDEIVDITTKTIEESRDRLVEAEPRSTLPDNFRSSMLHSLDADIEQAIDDQLGKRELPPECKEVLREIAVLIVSRRVAMPTRSGVVIAGFGEMQAMPELVAYNVYGAVNGKLIYDQDDENSTEPGNSAVLPFAQRDVVDNLLLGINPEAIGTIDGYLRQVFNRLPTILGETIEDDDKLRDRVIDKLRAGADEALTSFRERLDKWLEQRHVKPLLDVLAVLPKEELAVLAEALVSLTSVKRKMSLETETVGGPVDVAIISKGDGFVWKERKHYFDPTLNHAYLDTYFER